MDSEVNQVPSLSIVELTLGQTELEVEKRIEMKEFVEC